MTTRSQGILAVTLVLAAPPLVAQGPGDTLRLADALALAREANPALRAAYLRADAAAERTSQAGALPDPQLMLGLMNRPFDFGTDQAMTMNVLQLTQRLPWPGKLGFSEERSELLSVAAQRDADELHATLVARVTSVYYEVAYLDRAIDIMRQTRDLLRDFHQVSTAMYSVGGGLQQDVLQAQVAIASMTEDITVTLQRRTAMTARLNALLGRGPAVAVGALELPAPGGELPGVDSLLARAVTARPALLAAEARIQAADAGYRAARRTLYPDFVVTAGYGQRPMFPDLFTVSLGFSIPLWAGSRQLPARREMTAARAAEEAKALDLYNETYARLAEVIADADRASALGRLYATAILPQARAAVESAMSAYRVGQVDYMTLVQNELTVNRYEIERVRLSAEYHRAVAELEALIGGEIGGRP